MAQAVVRGRPGRTSSRTTSRSKAPSRRPGPPLESIGLAESGQRWLLAVPVLGTAGMVALWVLKGGATGLLAPGGIGTSLGRLTGLLCAFFFALSVLMMARMPRLERKVGQDQLVKQHRYIGVAAFALMLAHIVLITYGYAISAGLSMIDEFTDLVLNEDGMLPATAATGLMILVVLCSAPLIRRRLRYETWHLTHLWVYVAVVLAIPHETGLGTDLQGGAAVEAAWWGTWVAVLVGVLAWRLARPLRLSFKHQLVVEDVVRENADSVSIYIRGRNLLDLGAEPGQFFVWRFMAGRGWSRGHPYSLSAVPTDRLMRITVRDLGDGSGAVGQLRRGTRVLIEGPYGRMHPGVHPGGPAVLIASGIGITPMRAMLERLRARPGEITVLYRAATPDHLVFAGEIDLIARMKGIQVKYLMGRRRKTRRKASWVPESAGTISDAEMLEILVPGVADHEIYICGPPDWAESVKQSALDAGVPPSRIHNEFINW